MASSGFVSDDEDKVMELLAKWPLEYVNEISEYVCGWCGQVLRSDNSFQDLEAHFKSCKNTKENGLLMAFRELRKVNQKFEALKSELSETKKKAEDNSKTKLTKEENEERKAAILNLKAELKKEIMQEMKAEVMREILVDIKSEIITNDTETKLAKVEMVENDMEQLKKSGKMRETAISTLFSKINVLEEKTNEKMREMDAAQALKMKEIQCRCDGVTESLSNVAHSVAEIKVNDERKHSAAIAILSDQLAQAKKESETMAIQFRKESKRNIQTLRVQLENELANLKTKTESVSQQLNKNKRDIQTLNTQLECSINQFTKQLAKKKSLHLEPSSFSQLNIAMNGFNLVAHNYLFQPSYRFVICGMAAKLSRQTFEVSSEMFQWNGYPVQCRAKFHLIDEWLYVSLCMKDEKPEISSPIPERFYLLKDSNVKNPEHQCRAAGNLFGYTSPMNLETKLAPKSWLCNTTYNINNSVEIEIYVEPSHMAELVYSYDGTRHWTLENCRRRLQWEERGLIPYQASPYFYTSPNGYRVQVQFSLNLNRGYGFNKGPTAQILFLTGKFDAQLPLSFPHRTTITLINPKYPERSITNTIKQDIRNFSSYEIQICAPEELERQLAVRDTLFWTVTIEKR